MLTIQYHYLFVTVKCKQSVLSSTSIEKNYIYKKEIFLFFLDQSIYKILKILNKRYSKDNRNLIAEDSPIYFTDRTLKPRINHLLLIYTQ